MKKLIILSFAACLSFQLHSQITSIATAWDYLSTYKSELANGNEQSAVENLLAAKKEIDPVTSDPSTRGLSKAWKRKAEIYYYIFFDQSPRLTLVKEGSCDSAIHCFSMTLTVEKKENGQPKIEDKTGVMGFLGSLADTCSKMADLNITNSEPDAYFANTVRVQEAYKALLIADPKNEIVIKNLDIINGNLIITAANSGKVDQIMKYVSPLVEGGTSSVLGYQVMADVYTGKKEYTKVQDIINKGKARFPEAAEMWIAEINLCFEMGETDKAGTLIEGAKTKFPDKKADFILLEVNFLLTKAENEKALTALDEAIQAYKDNKGVLKLLYYNSAVIFSQLYTKAATEPQDTAHMRQYNDKMYQYYTKALEVEPTYHPAYNGQANYFITNGNNLLIKADAVPLNNDTEYKRLKALAIEEYKKAIDALEKAYAIAKEESYKRMLIALYEKTQQFDKKKALESSK